MSAREDEERLTGIVGLAQAKAKKLHSDLFTFQPGQHPKNVEQMKRDATTLLHAISLLEALYCQ